MWRMMSIFNDVKKKISWNQWNCIIFARKISEVINWWIYFLMIAWSLNFTYFSAVLFHVQGIKNYQTLQTLFQNILKILPHRWIALWCIRVQKNIHIQVNLIWMYARKVISEWYTWWEVECQMTKLPNAWLQFKLCTRICDIAGTFKKNWGSFKTKYFSSQALLLATESSVLK